VLAFWLFGLCAVAAIAAWPVWNARRAAQARNWPSTEATIQLAKIEAVRNGRFSEDLPCFAFSYVVDGEYYSGRFALSAKGDRADALIKEMVGKKLTVRYNPKRPASYFIPDDAIEGCEVHLVPN
jgi:hypothetical protein